jgi:hypothetical protein
MNNLQTNLSPISTVLVGRFPGPGKLKHFLGGILPNFFIAKDSPIPTDYFNTSTKSTWQVIPELWRLKVSTHELWRFLAQSKLDGIERFFHSSYLLIIFYLLTPKSAIFLASWRKKFFLGDFRRFFVRKLASEYRRVIYQWTRNCV